MRRYCKPGPDSCGGLTLRLRCMYPVDKALLNMSSRGVIVGNA